MEQQPVPAGAPVLDETAFGRLFTDHVLIAHHAKGWDTPAIIPFPRLSIAPSCAALHYGQAIFEGLKAYAGTGGKVRIFRLRDHFERMNRSARRMCMPELPYEIFVDGIARLVDEDRSWVPSTPGHSLYLRPLLFATDECVGLRESEGYTFVVMCCPVGAYHRDSVSLYLSRDNIRSHEGGTGDAKTAGNYAAGLLAARRARALGYDDVLWVDARTRERLEECGTMNVFFVLDGVVVTPPAVGTILPGVTRDSVLHLLRASGARVEERPITVSEILGCHERGELDECFGTGTAASIKRVERIGTAERVLDFRARAGWSAGESADLSTVAGKLESRLRAIRSGSAEAPPGWIVEL